MLISRHSVSGMPRRSFCTVLANLSVLTIEHSCSTVDEEELLYPRRHRLLHGHGVHHRDTDESSVGPRTLPIPS
jgi:hypothetical protein